MYSIEVTPAADRDLDKLKGRIQAGSFERLKTSIRGLADEPRPDGVRKIVGAEKAYRKRVWDYRVVYAVYDREKLGLILQVSRRNEATYR